MRFEKTVFVEQNPYPVVISDEKEALLAAQAAGRVIVGLALPGAKTDLWPAQYVYAPEAETVPERDLFSETEAAAARGRDVPSVTAALQEQDSLSGAGAETASGQRDMPPELRFCPDDAWLERVVRRHAGLPWVIAQTRRLRIRELEPASYEQVGAEFGRRSETAAVAIDETVPEAIPENEAEAVAETVSETALETTPGAGASGAVTDDPAERILQSEETFLAYVRDQYRFYECGLWAVERLEDGVIVGIAGVSPAEILWPAPVLDGTAARSCTQADGAKAQYRGGPPEQPAGKTGERGARGPVLELGYYMFRLYRRQGYAEEACRAILAWAEEEYEGQARVAARVRPENTASRQLLEKLGFTCIAEYERLCWYGLCL